MEMMTDENMRKLGKQIAYLRRSRHMTQEQLAEAADISVQHLSKIETGSKGIGLIALVRIATALDVPLDEFFPCKREKSSKIETLLADCTLSERHILLEITEAAKAILRKNDWVA